MKQTTNQLPSSKNRTSTSVLTGFTLIELLVVIAIISLLAAILFPVFGRARENARRSACLSNVKQWGLGLMQYVQDYDERFPSMGYEGLSGGAAEPFRWYNVLTPYTKSTGIAACPSDSSAQNADANALYDAQGNRIPRFSYLANDILGGGSYNGSTVVYNPKTLASVVSAADTIYMTEGVRGFGMPYFSEDVGPFITGVGDPRGKVWADENNTLPAADRLKVVRHFEGANFLFSDGHAKWQKVISTGADGKPVSQLQDVLPWGKHVDPTQTNTTRRWQ